MCKVHLDGTLWLLLALLVSAACGPSPVDLVEQVLSAADEELLRELPSIRVHFAEPLQRRRILWSQHIQGSAVGAQQSSASVSAFIIRIHL